MGTKKRRHLTQELLTRFQSKADFVQYFRHQLQLYVPPEKMLNRDFMRQLLKEKLSCSISAQSSMSTYRGTTSSR